MSFNIWLIHFPILYVYACMSDALLMIAAVKFYSLIMDDPLTSIKVELQWSKNQNSPSLKNQIKLFFFSIKSNKNQFSFMWMYHYSLPSVVSFFGDLQVLQHALLNITILWCFCMCIQKPLFKFLIRNQIINR